MTIRDQIAQEAAGAHEKYGRFKSTHEALGVLVEEFDELKAAIHANDIDAVLAESMQVSAVAMRLAECCDLESTDFIHRSTGRG